jgi:hypothetical protein
MHLKKKSNLPGDNIAKLLPQDARDMITGKGREVVRQIGMDVIRGIIFEVLCGNNLRDSTEPLTRKKIATLNAATLVMFIRGEVQKKGFVEQLPIVASERLKHKLAKDELQILQWVLGLTNKATQNVLRNSTDVLDQYRERYVHVCRDVVSACESNYGELSGTLKLSPTEKSEINWNFMVELLGTVGAQTLAIRGSEKSTYGKLFEGLVLGSLLSILGFQFVPDKIPKNPERVFWLASKGEKRESDATLLYEAGKGVRFDIGFIGKGNPEISLDKVSRFEREVDFGRGKWYLATMILVDHIGNKSKIVDLAKRIDGTIIQMSKAYWPKQVALTLHEKLGFSHELVDMPDNTIQAFLRKEMANVPIEKYIEYAAEGEEENGGNGDDENE